MTFPPKDLLDQLADLQLTLEGYSLEKLTVAQALEVRESFQRFLKVMESFQVPVGWEQPAKAGVSAPSESTMNGRASQALLRGAGVLCLTGNPLAFGELGRKLHKLGSRVYLASDSDMLLDLARRKPIDIILVEVAAPWQDMGTAIAKVRAPGHPGGASVPVLVISKNSRFPVKPGSADSGIHALNCPTEEALITSVSQLIAKHKTATEAGDAALSPSVQQDPGPRGAGDATNAPSRTAIDPVSQKLGFSHAVLEYTGRMRLAIPRGDFSGIADACRILRPHLHQWGAGALLDFTEDILASALQGKDLERIAQAQEEFLVLYPLVLKSLDDRKGK